MLIGIPFDTINAALVALTGEESPELQAAISNIIQPSTEASQAAEALGIQLDAKYSSK